MPHHICWNISELTQFFEGLAARARKRLKNRRPQRVATVRRPPRTRQRLAAHCGAALEPGQRKLGCLFLHMLGAKVRPSWRVKLMPLYGYARVSTRDQDLAAQDAELMAAGCAKVFKEKISGAKTDRPELAKVIN